MKIIKRFKPVIDKFSRQLEYYCSETDLTIFLIELIRSINLDEFSTSNDAVIISLIYTSMINKKIDLFRKHKLRSKEVYSPAQYEVCDINAKEPDTQILIMDARTLCLNSKGVFY